MFKQTSQINKLVRRRTANFRNRFLFLSCFLLLFVSPVRAADIEGAVTLEALLKGAQQNSPQLIASAADAQRYQIRVPLIDKLSDPILAFYYLDFPVANMTSGWSARENKEQAGPGTKVEGKKGRGNVLDGRDMVEDQALWYQYLNEDLILQISSQVRQIFYQVHFLDKIIRVSEESLATLDSLIETSNANYAVGKLRQKDVLRAQIERYQLQAELLRLRQQRLVLTSRLNYLTGRSPAEEFLPSLPQELTSENLPALRYPIINLISGLYTHKPLIKGYQALGGRFKAMRSMVQMYFNREVRDEAMFEADSGFRAIKAKGTDFYNSVISDMQVAAGDLEKNRELAGLYGRVIVPQGRQSVSVAQADFRVGKEEYSAVLKSILALNRDQILYYQALSDYMVNMAKLEELSGIPLN